MAAVGLMLWEQGLGICRAEREADKIFKVEFEIVPYEGYGSCGLSSVLRMLSTAKLLRGAERLVMSWQPTNLEQQRMWETLHQALTATFPGMRVRERTLKERLAAVEQATGRDLAEEAFAAVSSSRSSSDRSEAFSYGSQLNTQLFKKESALMREAAKQFLQSDKCSSRATAYADYIRLLGVGRADWYLTDALWLAVHDACRRKVRRAFAANPYSNVFSNGSSDENDYWGYSYGGASFTRKRPCAAEEEEQAARAKQQRRQEEARQQQQQQQERAERLRQRHERMRQEQARQRAQQQQEQERRRRQQAAVAELDASAPDVEGMSVQQLQQFVKQVGAGTDPEQLKSKLATAGSSHAALLPLAKQCTQLWECQRLVKCGTVLAAASSSSEKQRCCRAVFRLGLASSSRSSAAALRKSYKALALLVHPDKGVEGFQSEFEAAFKVLQQAWDMLK